MMVKIKIRFLSCHGFLPRLVANGVWNLHHDYCLGSQIPDFGAPLVWERYAIWQPVCLGEHLYFWVELTLACVLLLLQSMQPMVALSQLHFWPNPWVSLYFWGLEWIKWERQAHSSILGKDEREMGLSRENNSLSSPYLKLVWLLWGPMDSCPSWLRLNKGLGLSFGS